MGARGDQVTLKPIQVTGFLGPVSRSSVSEELNGDNFSSKGKLLGARDSSVLYWSPVNMAIIPLSLTPQGLIGTRRRTGVWVFQRKPSFSMLGLMWVTLHAQIQFHPRT